MSLSPRPGSPALGSRGPIFGDPRVRAPWEHAVDEAGERRIREAIGDEAPDFVVKTFVPTPFMVGFSTGGGILILLMMGLFGALLATPGSGANAAVFLILALFAAGGAAAIWNARRMRALVGPWVASVERGLLVADQDDVHLLPWDRFDGRTVRRVFNTNTGTVWVYKRRGPAGKGKRLGTRTRIGISGTIPVKVVEAAIKARLSSR